jgi:G:T-mismatch repair DNA endonuclease (very short patch repair protein)
MVKKYNKHWEELAVDFLGEKRKKLYGENEQFFTGCFWHEHQGKNVK